MSARTLTSSCIASISASERGGAPSFRGFFSLSSGFFAAVEIETVFFTCASCGKNGEREDSATRQDLVAPFTTHY